MPATSDSPVTVTQFTDPMCTWCWGSEPILRRLETVSGHQLDVEFVMGGLVENFDQFYDATNDISDPGDVAPHWLEAAERHGMPVETAIFESDSPQSTYPASIAFAAARLQDTTLAHRYLRLLREAYATQARNINHRAEQVELARTVGLDVAAFTAALDDGTAEAAFEADLDRTRRAGVRAFPTYRVDGPDGEFRASGFQPFEALAEGIESVASEVSRRSPPPVEDFVADYSPVATQEVAETYDLTPGKAREVLQALIDGGVVRREHRGTGHIWPAVAGGDA